MDERLNRRWNGWGDPVVEYPLPASALAYLEERLGTSERLLDADMETLLEQMPASRLPEHLLVDRRALPRLWHARGQSLPDWVALRYGQIEAYPDGVATPQDEAEVRQLLKFAQDSGVRLIPYGGGTSVVGHINPAPGEAPVLTIAMRCLSALHDLDEKSRLATFGAGATGPQVEAQLNTRGYTLGHFPQSFELSTLGGWIATRSSGQQSYYYGRIEDLFAGGRLESPLGTLELPAFPASAAGPDLRQLALGSEGRLGLITRATVRVRPLPQMEAFYGVFFHDWEAGMAAVRALAQERVGVSMARLSNAIETDTTLRLAGKERLARWAQRGLGWLGYGDERCLLIFGVTGERRSAALARRQASEVCRAHGGLFTGETAGKTWRKSRFLTPYLRNSLWEAGYAVDTLETALPWSRLLEASVGPGSLIEAMQAAIEALGERAHIFAHLSHLYRDGASLYVTCIFRRAASAEATLARWAAMKGAASQAIVRLGGTISHQHGVGLDHAAYLEAEKGRLGLALLGAAFGSLDPQGLLNPGKLLPVTADQSLTEGGAGALHAREGEATGEEMGR